MSMLKKALLVLGFTALVLGIVSCSSDSVGSGGGNFSILITDAPIDLTQVEEVRVVLDEFLVYPADGSSPIALAVSGGDPLTVNLLDYQNGEVVLAAEGEIPEGDYSRVRMRVQLATLVVDDDADPMTPSIEEPISLPSGKIDIPVAFTLTAGEDMTLTLDFDAERSVQVNMTNGRKTYIMRPVIVPVNLETS